MLISGNNIEKKYESIFNSLSNESRKATRLLVFTQETFFLTKFSLDTLLNVFLAIAVDNLANAEILTHDEEAAENKRLKENLQTAFEFDEKLGLNALSFVNNLQARVDGERLSIHDTNSISNSFDRDDEEDGDSNTEENENKTNNIHLSNGKVAESSPVNHSIIIQNGNPLTPETLMRKRKSQGLFDQVVLDVPDVGKVNCFTPKKTPYVLNPL